MSAIPQYHGCFTLLYGDPEVREQQQYLQPLYGLTAEDDPPITRHPRVSSQDTSLSSGGSSLVSAEDTHDEVFHLQRIWIPGEPAVRRHKQPRIATVLARATTGGATAATEVENEAADDDDGAEARDGEGRIQALPRGNNEEDAEANPATTTTAATTTAAAAAAARAAPRPPRTINRVELSLYADLCTGVVGPQPVFGGVALKGDGRVPSTTTLSDPSPPPSTPATQPYLFNSTGAPLLSSIVEADALRRLKAARTPYPAPQSRSGHVLLPYPPRGSLILYGGLGDDPFNDVWEYSTITGRWTKLDCVPAADDNAVAVPPSQQERQQHQREGEAAEEDLGSRGAEAVGRNDDDEEQILEVTTRVPRPPRSRRRHSVSEMENFSENDDDEVLDRPRPDETVAEFIARVQAERRIHNPSPSASEYDEYDYYYGDDDEEDGGSSLSDSDDDADMEDMDERNEETATAASRGRNVGHNRNMPPPAYGQSAALYVDENGDTCMAVLGGITVGDVCVHGFFSLNLTTLTWRRLETTSRMKDVWGATAQTLIAPRQYPRQPPAKANNPHIDPSKKEEQVVVLFGGMTAMGEVIDPTTHVLHLDHPLTAEEVTANPALFLDSIEYDKTESARVMHHVLREEDAAAQARDAAPADDSQTVGLEERCASWRLAHARRLVRWRERALRRMVGKYWTEMIPATGALHGRRRPTSAAFQRHYMYIFGGRDDLYFYNDLWCLNIVTRIWVQVRDGIPTPLLRRFLDEPENHHIALQLSERGAQLRRRTVAAVEAKLAQHPTNPTMSNMIRGRDVHHALYSSSVNSTARARTGACMVVDVQRECLYVYGGFSYTGQQHLTFFDLHAYYVKENVWRRVAICHGRPWAAALDAEQDAVSLVDPCEEARPYPRHARPPEGAQNDLRRSESSSAAPSPSVLPLTLMGYAARHLRSQTRKEANASPSSVCSPDRAPPAPLMVRRGQRWSCGDANSAEDGGDDAEAAVLASPQPQPVTSADYFHLPTFIPEARTMAAMAEDPLYPGTRFFLHGGRSGEEACGDLFELRTGVSRTVDVEYAKTQRATRLEAQTAAATSMNSSPTSPLGRSQANNSTSASTTAPPNPPANPTAAAPGGPTFISAASTAAAVATASGTQADVSRLQLRNRRQLQRQLISAALELQEEFEDAPAAHAATLAQAAPLPRHSLRDAATRWIRDGLAVADPKSLMFVELRNGHAVVNLRTHIHYSSRLSLLASSEQRTTEEAAAAGPPATGTTTATTTSSAVLAAPRSGYGGVRRSNSGQDLSQVNPPPAFSVSPFPSSVVYRTSLEQQMASLEGALKRAALSLEILLYDVLLSKPMCNGSGNNNSAGEGVLMTSPCTHSAVLTTSPENNAAFPPFPLGDGTPGTSPGNPTLPPPTSPHVQIVSRAQYSTPRTQQQQLQQPNAFPLPPLEVSEARTSEHPAPSPALTRRGSSFHGSGNSSSNGASFQQPPTNNEYDYHILLRSLFHHEPYYKAFGANEKKR
ncbi:hypothetical protein ABB37_08824 [Leptomonas pyrrhocoris]|uniref:Uncharacterized protein n=1 Tax=Leptomonas pyrrhocoris TaxID=157538 RepID=A0A0N0DRU9_LEPPY|nr:hypothetical protein ABB37_08824 [Leptomonas pyrrhocoris]KPA75162.1 hypothetical protein ABB37_08824 [Leptomonas pyrrhocoris]|eukprot:XP_015653601.1 hypothetical protein ABB37_08824 [Leptomonas pyrrhocoris]